MRVFGILVGLALLTFTVGPALASPGPTEVYSECVAGAAQVSGAATSQDMTGSSALRAGALSASSVQCADILEAVSTPVETSMFSLAKILVSWAALVIILFGGAFLSVRFGAKDLSKPRPVS